MDYYAQHDTTQYDCMPFQAGVNLTHTFRQEPLQRKES